MNLIILFNQSRSPLLVATVTHSWSNCDQTVGRFFFFFFYRLQIKLHCYLILLEEIEFILADLWKPSPMTFYYFFHSKKYLCTNQYGVNMNLFVYGAEQSELLWQQCDTYIFGQVNVELAGNWHKIRYILGCSAGHQSAKYLDDFRQLFDAFLLISCLIVMFLFESRLNLFHSPAYNFKRQHYDIKCMA